MKLEYLKFYRIAIYLDHPKGQAYGSELMYDNKDMKFEMYCRYRWYFKYRAALVQVANPKRNVRVVECSYEPDTKTKVEFLKDKLPSARGAVTKIRNRIALYKKDMAKTLFQPDEDDFVLKTLNSKLNESLVKLENYKQEIQKLENEQFFD